MEIKRIKKLHVNHYVFDVVWDKNDYGGNFSYVDMKMTIGTKSGRENEILAIVMHEISEIAALEMEVRLRRPDCDSDYVFVYDHRQFTSMTNMVTGMLLQFIK